MQKMVYPRRQLWDNAAHLVFLKVEWFMHDLSLFLMRHWLLVAAFGVVFMAVIFVESRNQADGSWHISTDGLVRRMNDDKAVVLDIRDSAAFKQGHIIGAINIPSVDFEQGVGRLNVHKHKPIVVVCYVGQSAKRIAKQMLGLGFDEVQILQGGMKAWQTAGLPLEKE